jgi:hypothetical protein
VDQLVNMKIDTSTNQLTPLATVFLSDSSTPLFVSRINLDSQGRLWYASQSVSQVGYFDTFGGTVTTVDLPVGTPRPLRLFSNHAGTETTMLTDDGDESDGFPILQVTAAAPEIQFSGTAFNQSGAENVAMSNILLATFTAPTGTYTANITWGDGNTTSVGTIDLGDNLYGIVVSSKTFADQGTFTGSISIVNSSAVEVGTLGFSTVISDTPLTITQFSVTNPNGHFADVNLTFTDDIDSQTSWFMASVNWGDNSTSAGIVVKDTTTPGQYFVIASHKYKKKGTYVVNASVTTSELNVTITTAIATATIVV